MTVPSRPQLRAGIAGLGQAGTAILPALLRHPRLRLTAAADERKDVLEAFARDFDVETHAAVDSLAASRAVDLIYVATPTHLHARHAAAALEAGKHVILEKPMATSLRDADGLIRTAGRHGLQLVVGHSQSFEPAIRAMATLVREGAIGRLHMLHNWCFSDWLYRPRNAEELDSALGGGVVFRQGAHQVDLLRWIAGGMVRSVRAGVSPAGPERTGDGQHTMLLQFVDGAVATAVYSGLAHFPSAELTFGIGEDGVAAQPGSYARARSALAAAEPGGERAMKGALGYSRPPSEGRPPLGFYGLTLVSGERGDIRQVPGGLMLYGDDGRHEIPVAPRPSGREALLDEVCEAIASDRPAAHDGRWGAANLEVTLAAWRSARSQREVILKRQVPVPRG